LLIEAIRYGDQPEVRARLTTVLDHALDRGQLQDLLEDRALARDSMDASRVHRIREDMERADARRLQPHYIESFFLEAFQQLGGTARTDEVITHLVGLIGSSVRVTLEVDAEVPAGVPDNVVRTVTENSRTLKFTSHGFESE